MLRQIFNIYSVSVFEFLKIAVCNYFFYYVLCISKGDFMRKLLVFIGMFLMFCTSAFASGHLELERIDGVYSSQLNMDDYSYFSSNQKKYIMDGRVVYCVEPGLNIMTMDYASSLNLYDSGFGQDVINYISLIGHFGYDYPGHQTDRFFLAAQELIWESIGNNDIHFTTGINDTGNMINISYEKNEILSLVNHYNLKPSFDETYISGIYDDEIVLVDKNNVLSNYDIFSSSNIVSIDGNKLKIRLSSSGFSDIVLKRKKYDDLSSVFYYASDSQDFMFLRADDEVTSTIHIDSFVPLSNIKIVKTGMMLDDIDDNNFIYKNMGLTGVKFGIYAAHDIYFADRLLYSENELIEEIYTFDGEAYSSDLPNGDYYIKELETLDDFILDDSIINVSLYNSKEDVYTYMVELTNDRKNVFLNLEKQGESFDKIVGSTVKFKNIPLSGIKFGLYSNDDIYDVDNELLVESGSLIKTFVTDNRGVISEKLNLPFGTYYVKELETLPGYKLDPNYYQFSVGKSESNDINIVINDKPILNEIFKGRLVINKIDSYGNKLSDACFKLFDDLDNLIFEGCTDSSGSIIIDNLPYGKYHFYEASAPYGYQLDENVYEFNVTNNSLSEFDVLNVSMPKTSDIYAFPRRMSLVGIGIGLLLLSLTSIYDKKSKNN